MNKQGYVYILSSFNKTSLYVGVTNDLIRRVYEHKHKINKGYTAKYYIDRIVYYEVFEDIEEAIKREKQIKGGLRQKKIDLINNFNSDWNDLYEDFS